MSIVNNYFFSVTVELTGLDWTATDRLCRGDIIGVTGSPAKTKKGELSIVPTNVSDSADRSIRY